ncbi:TPA: diguanylate cyclase [Vibrio parahaemolyticus]|uniref:GGDEF domain-containing protein n=1 Tax=Vibrio parahaemolyticus TaxID=670 RepID=UPI00084B9D5E|nr:sensor domain-containing diguanylate cyclase [Vibrio parahaemolyticus]EHK9124126.1 diguanylate cyclase [Vibrio parahaemolyticus]EHU4886344.1 diguanylate cyclase [Vibrio parahaemolyticus]EHU5131291.1 diguanylate cyclase [Vibrio parahaemolyticus]NVC27848.1 GGDEF domain-containing protein [Vibrio parahaemolyticus]ODY20642.1 diguanylate cyclase [Vibrio parahaemolyticus]
MLFSLEQVKQILNSMPDPIFILSDDGVYVDIFGGQDTQLYHDGSLLVGKSLHDVMDAEHADWFVGEIRRALSRNQIVTVEYQLSARDVKGLDEMSGPQGLLHFEAKICPLNFDFRGHSVVLWLTRNVSQRCELEAALRHQCQTDALTRIFNRRVFFEKLDEEIGRGAKRGYQASLLLFDLDYFKAINDRYGHHAGDFLLVSLTGIVSDMLNQDETFARMGGEEFAIILPGMAPRLCRTQAEKIRTAIQHHRFEYQQICMSVTASFGVTDITHSESNTQIYARADKALYQAKRHGRNCVALIESKTE